MGTLTRSDMVDKITPARRSENMRRIKSKGMKPEMVVRRLVHGLGYRYRLHRKDLPGKPDLVFGRRRSVVFVHGCFWHQHECRDGRVPSSNRDYWEAKLARNVEPPLQNGPSIPENSDNGHHPGASQPVGPSKFEGGQGGQGGQGF